MAALKQRTGGQVRFAGVGGARMAVEGLTSLFPIAELSIMGLLEVLPRVPRLLGRIRQTAQHALALSPDVMVTIDSPGFNFRLGRRLHNRRGFPLIHYVAPSVWAWRPERAKAIAGFLDHLMVLLPFEPPWFEREGLPCTFVGHSIVESGADRGDGLRFRAAAGIVPEAPVLCVLPGSRRGEARRLLPVFGEAVARLAATHPGLCVAVPTVDTVADQVRTAASQWPVTVVTTFGDRDKYDAFAASTAALAASGTVALELAMAGVPAVVAYKVNRLSGWMARRLLTVRYVNLVNIILDRPVVPELLQDQCTPDRLTAAVGRLLNDPAAAVAQRSAGTQAARHLGLGGVAPSLQAADVVLRVLEQTRTR
jgi:lipid-A-disaccharide synthase